jgi:hypothetical protein
MIWPLAPGLPQSSAATACKNGVYSNLPGPALRLGELTVNARLRRHLYEKPVYRPYDNGDFESA